MYILRLTYIAHICSLVQYAKAKPLHMDLPAVKLGDSQDITEEAVLTSLKRAISRLSTLQANDGHWPGDYGGPLFLLPGLVLPYILIIVKFCDQCK